MKAPPIIYKTAAGLGQDPQRLNNLVEQDVMDGIKAVWSKEGLLVNDPDVCMVDMALHLLDYARRENCGKCTPCREGTRQMYQIMSLVEAGGAKPQDLINLRSLAVAAAYGSDCSFGEIVGSSILDSLSFSHPEYKLDPEVKRDPYIGKWLKNGEYLAHIRGKSHCVKQKYYTAHFTPCQLRCPLGTDIAYFLSAVSLNKNTEAKAHIFDVNYLPRALGRVCGLCKQACTLMKERSGAIDINGLKDFVCCKSILYQGFENVHIDRAAYLFNFPLHSIEEAERGKKIVVVGAGPAGLVASEILARLGYQVTLLEKDDQKGGLMRFAIPRERLPDELLDEDLNELVTNDRITVKMNTALGRDVQMQQLLDEYDAVLLAVGAQKPISIGVSGEDAPQVLNFLQVMKDYNLGQLKPIGPRCATIGAGNSAMDVATAAKRAGYDSTVYYRRTRDKMRADSHEIQIAIDAGVNFEFEMVPQEIVVKNGKVVGINFDHKGETVFREADVIIPAIGQVPDLHYLPAELNLKTDKNGFLLLNPSTGATNNPKIFAAGDVYVGRTVANSIQEGVKAALSIHLYLSPEDKMPDNPWVSTENREKLEDIRKIASALYDIEDPYSEELRERWHNSIKASLRTTSRSEMEAAQHEAGACQRCRYLISIAY